MSAAKTESAKADDVLSELALNQRCLLRLRDSRGAEQPLCWLQQGLPDEVFVCSSAIGLSCDSAAVLSSAGVWATPVCNIMIRLAKPWCTECIYSIGQTCIGL